MPQPTRATIAPIAPIDSATRSEALAFPKKSYSMSSSSRLQHGASAKTHVLATGHRGPHRGQSAAPSPGLTQASRTRPQRRQVDLTIADGVFTRGPSHSRVREDWARGLWEVSRTVLWLLTPLIVGALAASVIRGRIAFGTWRQEWGGYDRQSMQDLKTLVFFWMLAVPVSGAIAGLLSFALKPSRRVAVLALLGVGECLGFFLALKWLLN
jgi:hypothetical protein